MINTTEHNTHIIMIGSKFNEITFNSHIKKAKMPPKPIIEKVNILSNSIIEN